MRQVARRRAKVPTSLAGAPAGQQLFRRYEVHRFVRSTAAVCIITLSMFALRAASAVHAQDADAGAQAAEPVTPPELLEPAAASYPEAARVQALEATVLLELTIDSAGAVANARVLEPAGHGFDEAALAAAPRLRFAPARRAGEPVVAIVRYPFSFRAPPPSAADVPEPEPPMAAGAAQEMVVTSERTSKGQRLQQSAEAVHVIDTAQAKEQTADLGDVLARTQGVAVRRDGGLGSNTRFSLNGLYDDQVRFFLDGVPLELAGFPLGVANVPVNLIDRVEIFRGVVPIRFGADALGGAVNLVTAEVRHSYLGGSYQIGSFGTHRATLDGRYLHEPSGLVLGASAFLDVAKNDYDVDGAVADARGRLRQVTVPRFHDAYSAFGARLEAGVIDRPWAKRLMLTGFASSYDKQLQNNAVMTVPYGEVVNGGAVYGATARYDVAVSSKVGLELTANYSHRIIDYRDASEWVYDWFGERILKRNTPGEVLNHPSDSTLWQTAAFARALLNWELAPAHTVRVSLSPAFTTRTGHERLLSDPNVTDPLSARNTLLTVVGGVEYEIDVLDERLSNIVFVKDYVYRADTQEPLPSGGGLRAGNLASHSQGIGDALRYRVMPWLYAKLSYEYATRLPRPDEVFGDGALIVPNLGLRPEVSHNANIGPRVELKHTPIGELTLDLNAFLRESNRLIALLGNDKTEQYENVYKARGLGLENAVSWMSPGCWLSLDGTLTWQDVRNASSQGPFGDVKGDRIPNRPYLFASWGARMQFKGLPSRTDSIEPFYVGRYVHAFFRGWESLGLRAYKETVDAQVVHDVGVSWIADRDFARMTATLEVQNLSDAKVYDNFGVQRPGRAFFAKLTATFH
jgi:vitamin B12 transporter